MEAVKWPSRLDTKEKRESAHGTFWIIAFLAPYSFYFLLLRALSRLINLLYDRYKKWRD